MEMFKFFAPSQGNLHRNTGVKSSHFFSGDGITHGSVLIFCSFSNTHIIINMHLRNSRFFSCDAEGDSSN